MTRAEFVSLRERFDFACGYCGAGETGVGAFFRSIISNRHRAKSKTTRATGSTVARPVTVSNLRFGATEKIGCFVLCETIFRNTSKNATAFWSP